MNYVPNLGELCDDSARRDAVHVAVAPVIAGEELWPGQRVGLLHGKAVGTSHLCVDTIGVVDPFLRRKVVYEGERFWLWLFPNTVTSLRHVWQHPAFKASAPNQGG